MRNFPLPRLAISRAYEKRTRAVMEKYTTGTRPLRRRSGCKAEENPYSATCADSFTDATFRRVVYQERRSAPRPFANHVGTNNPARCTSFLFHCRCNPVRVAVAVAILSFMTSTVYRTGLVFRWGESTSRVRDGFSPTITVPFQTYVILVFPTPANVFLIRVVNSI